MKCSAKSQFGYFFPSTLNFLKQLNQPWIFTDEFVGRPVVANMIIKKSDAKLHSFIPAMLIILQSC